MTERICGAEIALGFSEGAVTKTAVCERRDGGCPWEMRQDHASPRVVPPYRCAAGLDGDIQRHPSSAGES